MMDFFTHFLRKALHKHIAVLLRGSAIAALLCLCLTQTVLAVGQDAAANTSISALQVERLEGAVHVNAQIKFELPQPVEDVLLKGIPLIFVVDAEVRRDRWYWYDKKLITATRQMRLAYQPLTRRWRLNSVNTTGPQSLGVGLAGGLGGGLPQYFDTLSEALLKVQRINRWRIVDLTELDPDTLHTLEVTFKLDTSQLPRPFQIGLIGQNGWSMTATKTIRFASEVSK